jgi:hypothetical protein
MRSAGVCLALLVMIAPCPCLGQAAEQKPSAIDSADRLFQIGEFAQAGEQYARIAADAQRAGAQEDSVVSASASATLSS